ncbi:unnamed protein product [Cyclocybe aegerita]|uniref:Uncharacterized protein n=1 Tax=Cyclocybe aegerita TaxID=1973307 RepID=A0A8S0WLF1_CYCAE|nr:unnamed protein product [Cyclocybe aegerita]
MCLNNLPPEVLYDIVATVVVDHIDCAIASPPRHAWLHRYPAIQIEYVRRNVLARRQRLGLGPIIISIGSEKTEWSDFPEDKFNLIVLLALEVFGPDLTNAPLLPPGALDFLDRANEEDQDEWTDTDDDADDEGSDIAPPTRRTVPSSRPAAGIPPWANSSATGSSAEEFSDDEDNDSDIDDGEEDRKFEAFEATEKKELLPKNQIAPLLGVNGYVRETTLRVIHDTLGVKKTRGSKASIHKKIIAVLRELRWTYRIAHTPPFHCGDLVAAYKGPVTPFVDAYLGLSQAGYCLRSMKRYSSAMKSPFAAAAGLTDFGFQFILQTMKATRDIDLTISQSVLRTRVSQRAYIYHTQFRLWRRLVGHGTKIADAYEAAIQRSERRRLVFTVNADKCATLQQVLRNLVVFEQKYATQEYFDVFPRVLIKMSGIRLILKHLDGLRVVNSIRENEAALAIVREATDVLKTWRRKCKAKTSFYAVLNSGIRKIWFEGGKVMESTVV